MIIGITGGIGSGKSIACNIIKELGGKIIDCDKINERLLDNLDYIEKIKKNFANAVINNSVDRKKLSNIVFNDISMLEKLNSIAHPYIYKMLKNDIEIALKDDEVVFVEVPLLFECNLQNLFNKIWIIKSLKKIKTERVMKRDKKSLKHVENIMNNQFSYTRIAMSTNENVIDKCYIDKKNNNRILVLDKKTYNKTKVILNNTTLDNFDKKIKKMFVKLYDEILCE